ncbi:MAG TPA: pyruvate formate lyase-activating protein [Acholeplasmataceae bacterium]|jgi:pyruvate formate lyase activating enzyme|nr:pyruvate formate lyase-activating protein [Acholeplasmataceae bacterium]
MRANYHSIETFSSVDGPGIRYVLFLQGCNLRCGYCHNPDMLSIKKNKSITVDEIVSDFLKYQSFYTNGGITVSGGEPLLQIDFLIALFTEFKKIGIHTCIETQGTLFTDDEKYRKLIEVTDLFIINLKGVDDKYAKAISGYGIKETLNFIEHLHNKNKKFIITYVLLPTINDNKECAKKIAKLVKRFGDCDFEVLPYHKLGVKKWEELNLPYRLSIDSATREDVKRFIELIKQYLEQEVA